MGGKRKKKKGNGNNANGNQPNDDDVNAQIDALTLDTDQNGDLEVEQQVGKGKRKSKNKANGHNRQASNYVEEEKQSEDQQHQNMNGVTATGPKQQKQQQQLIQDEEEDPMREAQIEQMINDLEQEIIVNEGEELHNSNYQNGKVKDASTVGQGGENGDQAQMSTQQLKNKKKKEKKKQNKNKKEMIEKLQLRNKSEIKCPRDLEDYGIVTQLNDIKLNNMNDNHRSNAPKKRSETQSESMSSSSGDNDDNDVEELDDYGVNGYHPAHVGEILDSKYVLLKKLGWGHFSTVWLAFKLSDKQLYALKIQKSAEKYIDSAFEEEEILNEVAQNFRDPEWTEFLRAHFRDPELEATRDHTHNLQMFDQFFHHSLHGKHHTMAMEVLGKNLLSLIKKYDYRGIPIPIVRRLARQLLLGLDYMHRVCGIIHTDLKPENVVFALTEQQKFEYLYEHVLCGPLIEFFETDQPIILNAKQLKNQKKKDRKKRKKLMEQQQNQPTGSGELDEDGKNGEDGEVALTQEEQRKEERKTKTEIVVTEFSKKIEKVEAKYKMVPSMERKRAVTVVGTKPLQYENNFFEQAPEDAKYADPQDPLLHPLKKHNRRFLRVNSQPKLHSQFQASEEVRPRTHYDIERMREQDIQVKLCDMGNACYKDHHYSDIIQTREYRSPEVILGGDYDESADIWSLACMLFELVTGDYLFDPKKGKTYRKNDDHLALITELLGPCTDRNFLETHAKCWKFYDKKKKTPRLKNIKKLQPWPLYRVLLEKYRLKDCESRSLTSFLMCMLKWKPKDRASARELLDHPWLKETDDYSVWMSKPHLKEFKLVNREQFPTFIQELKLKKVAEEGKAMGLGEEEIQAYIKVEEEKLKEEAAKLEKAQVNGQAAANGGEVEDEDEEIEGTESSDSESSPYESGQSDSNSDDEDSEEDREGSGNDGDGKTGNNEDDDWQDVSHEEDGQ